MTLGFLTAQQFQQTQPAGLPLIRPYHVVIEFMVSFDHHQGNYQVDIRLSVSQLVEFNIHREEVLPHIVYAHLQTFAHHVPAGDILSLQGAQSLLPHTPPLQPSRVTKLNSFCSALSLSSTGNTYHAFKNAPQVLLFNRNWWHSPLVLLGRHRQSDLEFKVSLVYVVISGLARAIL